MFENSPHSECVTAFVAVVSQSALCELQPVDGHSAVWMDGVSRVIGCLVQHMPVQRDESIPGLRYR